MDKCQKRIVKKIASLFEGASDKAEQMIKERLEAEESLRLRAILRNEEYRPLDLLQLLVDFAKLAGANVRRQTPLITLLEYELRTDSGWAGVFALPKQVFDRKSLPRIHGRITSSLFEVMQ